MITLNIPIGTYALYGSSHTHADCFYMACLPHDLNIILLPINSLPEYYYASR